MPSTRDASESGSSTRTPGFYRILELITGILLCFVIVFTPWAFGATVRWVIWTSCGICYALGAIWLFKCAYRWRSGYRPATWESRRGNPWPLRLLGIFSAAFLLYVLIGCINYHGVAQLVDGEWEFEYRDAIPWLPHSFDAPKSWRAFWRYLALVCLFWAARDWFIGKTRKERRRSSEDGEDSSTPLVPGRIKVFLWVFCLSTAVMSLMGLLQRYDGTDKLLWLMDAKDTNRADFSFGPYSYRANAAQYFNMAWPVCLGFWWALRRDGKRVRDRTVRAGSQSHIMLVPCLVFMATGPIASTSRGGALVFLAALAASMLVMLWSLRSQPVAWFGIVGFFGASLTIALLVGGDQLMRRFETVFEDKVGGRTAIYEVARKMAADYPVFGTGAETFVSLYPIYRSDPTAIREGYAHDDWLEIRITLGWVGLGLLLACLGMLVWNWFSGRAVSTAIEFSAMILVSLGGVLGHAKFDFPFQIFSLVLVFVLLSSVACCLRRESVKS